MTAAVQAGALSRAEVNWHAGWRSHNVVWRVHGGSDSMSNRVLLHPKCHSKVHDRELKIVNPRLVNEALSEA